MFTLKAGKRTKYLLIGGAILVFFSLVYRLSPSLKNLSLKEETTLKERHLAKYREVILQKNALDERVESLRRTNERLQSGVFDRETPSLAAADIQKILGEITSRNGVSMKTVRVLKPEPSGYEKYSSIPVEFSISCSIRELKDILYRIDTSPKYLRVSKIQINVGGGGRGELIHANLTVAGIMKKAKA